MTKLTNIERIVQLRVGEQSTLLLGAATHYESNRTGLRSSRRGFSWRRKLPRNELWTRTRRREMRSMRMAVTTRTHVSAVESPKLELYQTSSGCWKRHTSVAILFMTSPKTKCVWVCSDSALATKNSIEYGFRVNRAFLVREMHLAEPTKALAGQEMRFVLQGCIWWALVVVSSIWICVHNTQHIWTSLPSWDATCSSCSNVVA